MEVSSAQPKKALSPIDLILCGIFTEVSPVHISNVPLLRDVTPSGISTEVSPLQP